MDENEERPPGTEGSTVEEQEEPARNLLTPHAASGVWMEDLAEPGPLRDDAYPLDEDEILTDQAEEAEDIGSGDSSGDEFERSRPSHLSQSLVERVKNVFEAPPSYRDEQKALFQKIQSRVFVVYGPEHAGKFTCSVRLAMDLLDPMGQVVDLSARIFYYRHHGGSLSLIEFTRSAEDRSAYIVEDAFSIGISDQDLRSPDLDLLNAELAGKKAYLILTTTRDEREIVDGVTKICAVVKDRRQILKNHLDRYRAGAEEVQLAGRKADLAYECWNDIEEDLSTPLQIDDFCKRLGGHCGVVTRETIKEIAVQISRLWLESDSWFKQLRTDEKVYALLVVLLDGIDRISLHELFTSVLERLRTEGMKGLVDPRRIGQDDLLDRIKAYEAPSCEIVFKGRLFEDQAWRQVKNFNHLLWSVVPLLCELLEGHTDASSWAVRRSLATAVGRIGIHHPENLRTVLVRLAGNSVHSVAAAGGYALSEIYRLKPDSKEKIFGFLEEWSSSADPSLMWAAGAALWRMYAAVKEPPAHEELLGIVSRLAVESLQLRSRDCVRSVLFAISKIAAVDPPEMVTALTRWLAGEPSRQRKIAQLASRKLFEATRAPGTGPLLARQRELLRLVGPLLSLERDEYGARTAMLATLVSWSRQQERTGPVAAALLQAVNRTGGKQAATLRARIARHFLASDAMVSRQLGWALLARSLALEGAAFPPPNRRRCVLVLDASLEALTDSAYSAISRRLWEMLMVRFDVFVVRMGTKRVLESTGGQFPAADLPTASRPRLLVPTIKALDRNEPSPIVVLTWGNIVDLEDARREPWSGCTFLATTKPAAKDGDGWPGAAIHPRQPEAGLVALERKIDSYLASILAQTDLAPVDAERNGPESIETQLDRLVEALDQTGSVATDDDNARFVLRTVLWLATTDMERCVRLLSGWLEQGEGRDLARRVGLAAASLLFRIESHRRPVPAAPLRALLFSLAPALSAAGWSGTEAVLYAVRRWLSHPAWAATLLLAPDGQADPLTNWVQGLLPLQAEALREALKPWRLPLDLEEGREDLERICEVAERLEARISLGSTKQAPEIAPGERVGVLVLDAGSADRSSRLQIAKLATTLIAQFADRLPLLVYRLGERSPITMTTARPGPEALFALDRKPRPRLLGPLLRTLPPGRIAFVLLLTAGAVVDAADWCHSPLSLSIRWYSTAGTAPPIAGFTRIVVPEGVEEAGAILQSLATNLRA